MFRTFTCPSSGVLIYMLFHCRMWCYAIGVEAVVLRSWCVVLCTVCQLVSISNSAYSLHKMKVKYEILIIQNTNVMHLILFIRQIFSSTCFEYQVLIFRRNSCM